MTGQSANCVMIIGQNLLRVDSTSICSMTAQVAIRTPFVKGSNQRYIAGSPSIAALSQTRGRVLRSARALTTMAASSYKYVVLGGGNASG